MATLVYHKSLIKNKKKTTYFFIKVEQIIEIQLKNKCHKTTFFQNIKNSFFDLPNNVYRRLYNQ